MKEHREPSSVTIAKETHEPSKITTITVQLTGPDSVKKLLKRATKVLAEQK